MYRYQENLYRYFFEKSFEIFELLNFFSYNIYMSYFYYYAVDPLSKSQELGLAEKAAGGDRQAREMLIRANIRYALSYAKNFYGQGLSNDDVDDEAVIGLIKAVDHFDYSRGNKIITFAKMYILNEIVSARNKSGYLVRQSDGRLRMILKINRALKKIGKVENQKKLLSILAAKTGLDKKIIQELLEESRPCLSLDEPLYDKSEETRGSVISDSSLSLPEEKILRKLEVEELYRNLDDLEPLEKQIICMLYGLQKYKRPYSLSEIGQELNESRQYVFYVKERAMKKLKRLMGENEERAA